MPIWSSRPAGVPPSSDSFSLARIALPAFGPSLLFGLGEGAIYPVLALSARDLGASSALAGLIVALIGIGSMMANLPAAALTNRYGERRAMIGAAVFSLAAMALCLAARSPWVFGLGVLMIGLASSIFLLARQTYLIEAVPPAHARARHVHPGGHHAGGPVRRPLHGRRLHPPDGACKAPTGPPCWLSWGRASWPSPSLTWSPATAPPDTTAPRPCLWRAWPARTQASS